MKRGQPSKRKTGLSRRGALVRNAELTRKGEAKTRKPLVAKPRTVTPEERRARKLVKARTVNGLCEVCGRAPAENFQHRQNKSQLGAWTAENGLAVCGQGNATGCHGRIHQNPAIAYERGWSVRSTSDPATVPAWLAGRGWVLLLPDGSVEPAGEVAA